MIVQLQEATQYYYYRAVLAIFPLTLDQIRAQIWPNGDSYGKPLITTNTNTACREYYAMADLP